MNEVERTLAAMIEFDAGDPRRIQHFLKVHGFARLIGLAEGLDAQTQYRLELAAAVHDIGIRPSERKYGRCDGKLQEREGPEPAEKLLTDAGVAPGNAERVCFLVAHHHTNIGVDGADWRILLEADALVNLYEDDLPQAAARQVLENVFRTDTGIALCKTMYGL